MTRSCLAVAVLVVTSLGCKNQEKLNREALKQAIGEYQKAIEATQAGRLRDATDASDRATELFEKLIRQGAPALVEQSGAPGPTIDGRSTAQWQEQWDDAFKATIEEELPNLLARTSKGELEWSTGRAFLTRHRPDLDSKWVAVIPEAATAQAKKLRDALVYRCDAPGFEAACERLRAPLEARLGQPLSTGRLLTADSAKETLGVVTANVRPGQWHNYSQETDPARALVYSLPGTLEVELEVAWTSGAGVWNGTRAFSVTRETPEKLAVTDMTVTRDAHFEAMLVDLLAKLSRADP